MKQERALVKLAKIRLAINHVRRNRGLLKEAALWSVLSPLALPITDTNYPNYGELRNYLPTLPDKKTVRENLFGLKQVQPFNFNKPAANSNRNKTLYSNPSYLTNKSMWKPELELNPGNSTSSGSFGGMVGAFNRVRQSAHNAEVFDALRYLMQAGASPAERAHLSSLNYQDFVDSNTTPNGEYDPMGYIRNDDNYIPGVQMHEIGHGIDFNGMDSFEGTPDSWLERRHPKAIFGSYNKEDNNLMPEYMANIRARDALYKAFESNPRLRQDVLNHFDNVAKWGLEGHKLSTYPNKYHTVIDNVIRPQQQRKQKELYNGSWELGNRIINYARSQGFNPPSSTPYSGINPYLKNLNYIITSGTDR